MFKNFDFIGHKKIWFTFSGIMIILSIISIIMFRFNWGIDFTGGTILELGFDKNVTVEEVRDGLREDGLQTATIQLSGNMSGETSNDVIIRTRNLSSEEAQTVVGHVKDKVGSGDVKRIETVGAVIGSEVTRSTLLNVLISFGAMILYMSIRFEHRIAISAIVAICHDILMVLGVFAFFHLEVDASFLAAILTVLGYSMNESVVIFDRIRENLQKDRQLCHPGERLHSPDHPPFPLHPDHHPFLRGFPLLLRRGHHKELRPGYAYRLHFRRLFLYLRGIQHLGHLA